MQTDRYNGLHWRVRSVAGNRTTTRTYSASWQLLQEDVRTVITPFPEPIVALQRFQNVWGARYIDDAVLRRLDSGSDGTEDGRWYYLTDAQFSVRAVLDGAGKLTDRIRYSAYGVARHGWRGDTDGDGATTLADRSILLGKRGLAIGDAGYSPDCDLDRSGAIDSTDASLWAADGIKAALPAGWLADLNVLTSPGGHASPVGYCGYLFNPATQLYLARLRTYDPGLGRWLEWDPMEYQDGANLSEYVAGNPVDRMDPSGLKLVVKGTGEFRAAVLAAMKQACPRVKIAEDGTVTVDAPPGDDETDCPSDPAAAEKWKKTRECSKNSPGCDVLKALIDSNHEFPLESGNNAFWWEPELTGRKDRNTGTYPGYLPKKGGFGVRWRSNRSDWIYRIDEKGKRVRDRKAAPWEALWHELNHAYRFDRGEHPASNRNRWPVSSAEIASEEKSNIEESNKFAEWWAKCGAPDKEFGDGPGKPRDSRGH